MIDSGYPKLVFNKNDFTVTTTGDGTIRTWTGNYEEDTRTEHEKFFGMDEEQIYKKYGITFTKTNISIGGKVQYKMSSDFEAMLWLIRKGFVKYVRGKEVWNEEALDEGWENAWTPPENYEAPKKSSEWGHVYFVESKGYWKIGRATASRIKIRIKEQQPDKVLAVSPRRSDFKSLERKLHKMFKDKRVLKYEVFRNLNKDDIKVIMNELGNKINIVM
tara:strand:- start:1648 stop:2301 length:654 start_codon:yes stop_codon:yes gene_type:complete